MESKQKFNPADFNLPESFFEQIIGDIPSAVWIKFFQTEPSLKGSLFEGFSTDPTKLPRAFSQPKVRLRLRRLLRTQPPVLEAVLKLWGNEHLARVAFVEMFDPVFVLENWNNFKDFLGPERFFASLHLLGYLEQPDYHGLFTEDYWQRRVDLEAVEFLFPVLEVCRSFVQEHPQAAGWIEDIPSAAAPGWQQPAAAPAAKPEQSLRGELKKRLKLEQKLEKSQAERQHLHDQLSRCRQEAEALRTRLSDLENSFEVRLHEQIDHHRRQWYSRYQTTDEQADKALEEARGRLEAILSRADRAFALQRQADEQYGLVADVRQKLLRVDLYLREIEKIHADSLVVHSEVVKVKKALEDEKKRLLQLPGVEKALRGDVAGLSTADLSRQVHLLEAVPESLAKISQMRELLQQLAALGVIDGLQPLQDAIRHKQQQILEALYARFPPHKSIAVQNRRFRSFEEFVHSGQSKKYDLYLDGYNILLKAHTEAGSKSVQAFSRVREDFIEAVARKSHLFRRVYLIFDGLEESRDRKGNLDIIYSGKARGDTADTIIIDALRRRKDQFALLVTEDQGLIDAVEGRIYGIVGAYHFYLFIYAMDLPLIPSG